MLAQITFFLMKINFDPIENIENALEQWYKALEQLVNMVTTNPKDVSRIGSLIQSMITNVTIPVGDALVVLCFFLGSLGAGATIAETKRPEVAVRLFARTAIASAFVQRGYTLVSLILETSLSLIGDLVDLSFFTISPDTFPKVPDTIKTAVQAMTFPSNLIVTIIGLIGSLAITVCGFVILLTVYGRWFKVYMYMIISPIPLATFAAQSTQQVGIQFLRNFVAVTLEGVVMVIAIWTYNQFQNYSGWQALPETFDPTTSPNAMVWNYLQITIFNMLILLTIIKTSNQLAKEMFGV